ncbi:N-alpha-acetyl-L-2,4-diaminobutyrate deacetylase [Rhizobium giardinii]|uniref:N-alpha-acetyl-L-2,4-diaminobutyrate deacetylase n=2 Tax=Rhizobium giardinii TaxID=56731 RepID=A0A7W8UH62_9HYPH|nr:N-alpha-acetyl-L-2,4-diaminobutyrate deacetylase [Rhizobium giardinii]
MVPITVVRCGEGPTALLTGGNHGDEYEGPIALFDLARSLKLEEVGGAVIIIPAMNYPAFLAGTRTSPIDKGNMNRSFPGAPDGTVTQKIADYFQRTLLPLADIVLDFHSGGKTLDFLPFCAAHILPNKEQEARSFELVRAFGAPYSMKMLEIDAVGMYDTAAEEMGKIFITTELGGGGTATAKSAGIAKAGVANVLKAAGILKGMVKGVETTWLDMPDGNCFSFAEDGGLIEPIYDLGNTVKKNDVVAHIYPVGRTGAEPLEVKAKMDGILTARHFPGLVKPGDCVSVVATIEPA